MALSSAPKATVYEMDDFDKRMLMAGLSLSDFLDPSSNSPTSKSVIGVADLDTGEIVSFNRSASYSSAVTIREDQTKTWEEYFEAFANRYIPEDQRSKANFFFRISRIVSRYEGTGVIHDSIELPLKNRDDEMLVRITYLLERSKENGHLMATFLIINVEHLRNVTTILMQAATRDGLTGLLNRETAAQIINDYICDSSNGKAVLAVIDIDDFKPVNDRFGHRYGDIMLAHFATELSTYFGDEVVVSRTGGDEFLLFFPNFSIREAAHVITEFAESDHVGFVLDDYKHVFHCSIGYSIYPDQAKTYDDLTTQADDAMYAAKMSDATHHMQYDPYMERDFRSNLGFSMRDIANCMPGAMLVYKADGDEEILFANKELIEMFECSSFSDFLEHTKGSFRTLVHPDDIDRVEGEIWQQIPTYDNIDFCCYRIIAKNGKVKNVEDYGRLVQSRHLGPVFYVAIHDLDVRDKLIAVNEGLSEDGHVMA